jgi:cell division protein FtsQ
MRRLLLRRAPLAAAFVLVALLSAFLLLRDADTFAVREVAVRGASGPDAPKVETALKVAARDMTTLNVDGDELTEAAAKYPTVKAVEVDRDLPHGVTLIVREKRPVAVIEHHGRPVPLAADGRLLQGATPPDDLPRLALDKVIGTRIDSQRGRQLVALVAAAPAALRSRADKAALSREHGLMLTMREGPDLYFGAPADLPAKWKAVARVLADPTSDGASYVDVRVPERPAAGGLAPITDPEAPTDDQGAPQEVPAPAPASPSTGA